MPGKTSWHSEPPATWLFNFNGLHQMFQAKGPARNQNRRAPNPWDCSPPSSFLGFGHPSCWDSRPGLGAAGGAQVSGHLSPPYSCFSATWPIIRGWAGWATQEPKAFSPLCWSSASSLDSGMLAMPSETYVSLTPFVLGKCPWASRKGRQEETWDLGIVFSLLSFSLPWVPTLGRRRQAGSLALDNTIPARDGKAWGRGR